MRVCVNLQADGGGGSLTRRNRQVVGSPVVSLCLRFTGKETKKKKREEEKAGKHKFIYICVCMYLCIYTHKVAQMKLISQVVSFVASRVAKRGQTGPKELNMFSGMRVWRLHVSRGRKSKETRTHWQTHTQASACCSTDLRSPVELA